MSKLQKRIAFVGLSKQATKGTLLTPPTYGFGLRDGGVANVEVEQAAEEITHTSRIDPYAIRTAVMPGAEFTTRAYPRSLGLLLYGALGSISTVGAAAPYTHTITPGDDLPWLSLFGRLASEYVTVKDCKIDELSLSWDGSEPLEVAATILGGAFDANAASWTATNDEGTQSIFAPPGSTLKLDVDGATPVAAKIRAGELTIANNLEQIQISEITPDDVFPARQVIEATFTIVPEDDINDFRAALTGTPTGTTAKGAPVYGSFDLKFSIDADTDLQLVANRVAFRIPFPEADPAGGPVELEAEAAIVIPTGGGDAFTATLRNAVTSY